MAREKYVTDQNKIVNVKLLIDYCLKIMSNNTSHNYNINCNQTNIKHEFVKEYINIQTINTKIIS